MSRGSNIDEWKSRVETFIGVTYPSLKKLFATENEGPNGQKHFATPMEDLEIVHPHTRDNYRIMVYLLSLVHIMRLSSSGLKSSSTLS